MGKGERRARGGFTAYDEIDRPARGAEVEEVMRAAREAIQWEIFWLEFQHKKSFEFSLKLNKVKMCK